MISAAAWITTSTSALSKLRTIWRGAVRGAGAGGAGGAAAPVGGAGDSERTSGAVGADGGGGAGSVGSARPTESEPRAASDSGAGGAVACGAASVVTSTLTGAGSAWGEGLAARSACDIETQPVRVHVRSSQVAANALVIVVVAGASAWRGQEAEVETARSRRADHRLGQAPGAPVLPAPLASTAGCPGRAP